VAAAAPAYAGSEEASTATAQTSATACLNKPYSYAGLQSEQKAYGVAATLVPTAAPAVVNGHVGGWIGLGGTEEGPGGVAEWLQVGLAAMTRDASYRMYYEVTVAGAAPRFVEIAPRVQLGEAHRVAVLEIAGRDSWWRVWVDGKPVSAPIELPGSHGKWFPQAIAENWNGGTGTCNGYAYRFSNITVAKRSGGSWQPFGTGLPLQDEGYRVVRASTPGSFLATSVV
jgi:hypothetical protein